MGQRPLSGSLIITGQRPPIVGPPIIVIIIFIIVEPAVFLLHCLAGAAAAAKPSRGGHPLAQATRVQKKGLSHGDLAASRPDPNARRRDGGDDDAPTPGAAGWATPGRSNNGAAGRRRTNCEIGSSANPSSSTSTRGKAPETVSPDNAGLRGWVTVTGSLRYNGQGWGDGWLPRSPRGLVTVTGGHGNRYRRAPVTT